MRLHSDKQACPRKGNPTAVKAKLSRRQTERGGKVFWDTEESDRHPTGCGNSCVASKPLCPREASVGALGAGKDHFCFARRSCGGGCRLTSMRWCRRSCIQARRCALRLQSRQSKGAGPTWRGWSSKLIRRGFVVASPFH